MTGMLALKNQAHASVALESEISFLVLIFTAYLATSLSREPTDVDYRV